MRKNSALAALTEDERNQILGWLETNTYDDVRERVAKPRPEGFNLKISNKPLQNLRAAKETVDRINRRIKEGKALTLADLDAIRSGQQKVLSEEVHDAILEETYDQVLSRENTPNDLLKLQQLADFEARSDYRTHKVSMDLHQKEMSEKRFALSERALDLRERALEAKNSADAVAPAAPIEDALGRLARTRADVRRRARAKFGYRSADIAITSPQTAHETTEEITIPSASAPASSLPIEPVPTPEVSALPTETPVATAREDVANLSPAPPTISTAPEPKPTNIPDVKIGNASSRGDAAPDSKHSSSRGGAQLHAGSPTKSEIETGSSVDNYCDPAPPSSLPSRASVETPIAEKTKSHAIKRWRAHIRRPAGTPEPDTSWRNECPCGNLAPCAEHPTLKSDVRYYRPQNPSFKEGLDAANVPYYKPTAAEIGCTQEDLDKSCDHFAYNPRAQDPPDPRFAPDWLKPPTYV